MDDMGFPIPPKISNVGPVVGEGKVNPIVQGGPKNQS